MSRPRDPRALASLFGAAVPWTIGVAAAIATMSFAGAASAASVSPPPPASADAADFPLGADMLPASLLNWQADVPQPIEPLFRADAGTPSSIPSRAGSFGVLSGVWESQTLLGDMGGLRPALAKYGVTLSILENVETFGNVSGGVRQGFEVNGLTTATLQVDTEKAFGLAGGLLNVSGLQIWGGNLSLNNLLTLQEVSDIEAPVGIRLWELWYDQKFGDKFDIRAGEQSLDEEFIVSPSAFFFLNAASGWPELASADLPGGGPAYPLAGLGIRGRAQVSDSVAVLAGVFNGSPIPKGSPNTPASNPNGVSFPLDTGVFAIAELQFTVPGLAAPAKTNDHGPLPGVYKLGAWYDSDKFDDLRYDNLGAPLASPMSNGSPATHHGAFSIYGIMDQMIWRSKEDANRSLNVFIRPVFSPLQDRNLITFSLNAGLNLHAPFPGRDNDIFGLEMGVARVSNGVSGYDRQLQFYRPAVYRPVRSAETFIEATYQAQLTPWWQIQPDIQYIINPGAGGANPNHPTQRMRNALVFGLRTNVTF